MESTFEIPLAPPQAGQRYRDAEGRHWLVQEVRPLRGSASPDYYMLRMVFSTAGQRGASLMVSKHEFLRLASQSGLRWLLAP